jgi:hypothetical protein
MFEDKLISFIIEESLNHAMKMNASCADEFCTLKALLEIPYARKVMSDEGIDPNRLKAYQKSAEDNVDIFLMPEMCPKTMALIKEAREGDRFDDKGVKRKGLTGELTRSLITQFIHNPENKPIVEAILIDETSILEEDKFSGTQDNDTSEDVFSGFQKVGKPADTVFQSHFENPTKPKEAEQKAKKNPYYESKEETLKIVRSALTDLKLEAKRGRIDPVIGREQEIQEIIKTLMRRHKSNVLLVGQPGVGKTAIIEGLALAMQDPLTPKSLRNRNLYMLSLANILSGTRFRGDFEQRMEVALAIFKQENAIVFVDEFHTLMSAGNASNKGLDAVNMLKPAIARGEFSLIGATTIDEAPVVREDQAFMRRLNVIDVREPNHDEMIHILTKATPKWIGFHKIKKVEEGVFDHILSVADQITTNQNPDKSLDILDRACVIATDNFNEKTLGPQHIHQVAIDLGVTSNPTDRSAFRDVYHKSLETFSMRYKMDNDRAKRIASSVANRYATKTTSTQMEVWNIKSASEDAALDVAMNIAKLLDVKFCNISGQRLTKPSGVDYLMGNSSTRVSSRLSLDVDIDPYSVIWIGSADAICEEVRQFFNDVQRDSYFLSDTNRRIYMNKALIITTSQVASSYSLGFGRSQDEEFGEKSWPEFSRDIDLKITQENFIHAWLVDYTQTCALPFCTTETKFHIGASVIDMISGSTGSIFEARNKLHDILDEEMHAIFEFTDAGSDCYLTLLDGVPAVKEKPRTWKVRGNLPELMTDPHPHI